METSTTNESTSNMPPPETYFYVFIDDVSYKDKNSKDIPERLLDSDVNEAFRRISLTFDDQIQVQVNPSDYHKLRKAFGIQQLPAFGISDFNLSEKSQISSQPQKLPSIWNVFDRKQRKEILNDSEYLPKVERSVIEKFRGSEELFHFIRDLHITNVDNNLSGVTQEIEKEITRLGGRKLLNAVNVGKKVFFG